MWNGKRTLVTGAAGFIGSHLVERLLAEGARVRACGRSRQRFERTLGAGTAKHVEFLEGDLSQSDFSEAACRGQELAFHLAGKVAGVGYNSRHPGSIFVENSRIGLNVIEAAARNGLERLLVTSTACVYRRHCAVPTPETEGFVDDPEPTNLGYGWAKRMLEVQASCFTQEFPIKIALPRPYNAYGPRDDFEWETSHVIPALIRKVMEGHDPIEVWGDGSQTRSFLYVSDFVEGLLLALERYAVCEPVNIGSDEEVAVGRLIEMIAQAAGRRVRVSFDTSRPGGQPRRVGDYAKAREVLGFRAKVPLSEGLRRTIDWYSRNRP